MHPLISLSPPKLGGARGGLNRLKLCRYLWDARTASNSAALLLPMGRKNRLKLNAQRPHVYVGLIQLSLFRYWLFLGLRKKQMQCNNAILLFVNSPGYNREFITYLLP